MVEYEADDALASAAHNAAQDEQVERVFICTPDKDLGQCVTGTRVVQMDRRRNLVRDEAGIIEKFGVKPQSIPDYLAVVGDSADGYPGIAGWGVKAAASVLSRYGRLQSVPKDWQQWHSSIRKARPLSESLFKAGRMHCSSLTSPPCALTCPYSKPFKTFVGEDHSRGS
ncbi:MAG: 5'-3' exonuclease H3TH domain-containing protein [Candidatus Korobacteraceae bacterium]